MAAKDAEVATDYFESELFVYKGVAALEIEVVSSGGVGTPAGGAELVELFVVNLGALSGDAPAPAGPPQLSDLESEIGGIGFGIRTAKARG